MCTILLIHENEPNGSHFEFSVPVERIKELADLVRKFVDPPDIETIVKQEGPDPGYEFGP